MDSILSLIEDITPTPFPELTVTPSPTPLPVYYEQLQMLHRDLLDFSYGFDLFM